MVPTLAGRAAMLPTFATAAVAVAFAVFTHWENQRFDRTRGLLSSGQKSLHVIQAFRSLDLQPPPGQLDLVETRNAFPPKRILSGVRCVARLERPFPDAYT